MKAVINLFELHLYLLVNQRLQNHVAILLSSYPSFWACNASFWTVYIALRYMTRDAADNRIERIELKFLFQTLGTYFWTVWLTMYETKKKSFYLVIENYFPLNWLTQWIWWTSNSCDDNQWQPFLSLACKVAWPHPCRLFSVGYSKE